MVLRLSVLTIVFCPGLTLGQEFIVKPYVQNPSPQSMWIHWETDRGDESRVTWGRGEALDQTTEGGHRHLHNGSRLHTVELRGLAPSTTYRYQVHTADLSSPIHHFKTPPTPDSESPFNLLAMSDMQQDGRNPDRYREIIEEGVIPFVRAALDDDLSSALGLALIPGDLVDEGNDYAQWHETFFRPGEALMPYVPFMPVPGNHERNSDFFFSYFNLPPNGTPGSLEHWWYTDYSNVRIIGLDSNGLYRAPPQLEWLDGTLNDACVRPHIDFVFVQLHHPHHSELWPRGNTPWTGEVIRRLEAFSTECGKPSIHFFGHTHGYSRGQSQAHQHLMVNVATAGGNIDYWGEYNQTDYPEYSVSQDEYGFVVVEVAAGDAPHFTLTRVSRGDELETLDNQVRDLTTIHRYNEAPATPTPRGELSAHVNPDCFTLAIDPFRDPDDGVHQATQWQVAHDCDGFDGPVLDDWVQDENWYLGLNTLEDTDLTEHRVAGLDPMQDYCWRARVRDDGLVWSPWSEPKTFRTGQSNQFALELINPGAEEGIIGWTVEQGIFESLQNGECDGVPPYAGDRAFNVGGACEHSESARVSQRVVLRGLEDIVSSGRALLTGGGQLRNFDGSDHPDFFLRLFDENGDLVQASEPIGTLSSTWTEVTAQIELPPTTHAVELVLRGLRNAGQDNDSYFDNLFLNVRQSEQSCDPPPSSEPEGPPEDGVDAGSPVDSDANPPKEMHTDAGMEDSSLDPASSIDGSAFEESMNDAQDVDIGISAPSDEELGGGCLSCNTTDRSLSPLLTLAVCLLVRVRFRRRQARAAREYTET